MANWNDDGGQGHPPNQDQWQEMPSYYDTPGQEGGNGYGQEPSYMHDGSWDEPTERPVPESGPVVPVEHLSTWIENSWNMFVAGVRDLALVQLILCAMNLVTFGLLTGPFMAGYYRYAIRRTHGQRGDYNDLFSGFSETFKATFLVGLGLFWGTVAVGSVIAIIDLLLSQIPVVGLVLRAAFDLSTTFLLSATLGLGSLMIPLIHEQGYTLVAAFEAVLGTARANWARAALFGLVVGGLPVLGAAVFGLGILVGGPLGILVGAQGYRVLYTTGDGNPPLTSQN